MLNWIMLEEAVSSTATAASGTASLLGMILPFALVILIMYFFMIRPQKKKEKQADAMRNSLQIGDTVTTIGGITGIVNSLKEDEFIMETATDRTKLCFKRWAIQEVKKMEL